jgi:hypothetical protein
MKLPQRRFLQMLLGSGHVMALGKISDNLLAHPASIEDSCLGIGETPLQVWDKAVVRGLLAEVVRVLEVQLLVCLFLLRRDETEHCRAEGYGLTQNWPSFPICINRLALQKLGSALDECRCSAGRRCGPEKAGRRQSAGESHDCQKREKMSSLREASGRFREAADVAKAVGHI